MTKETRSSNDEGHATAGCDFTPPDAAWVFRPRYSVFGFRHSFVIRHSSFVIRIPTASSSAPARPRLKKPLQCLGKGSVRAESQRGDPGALERAVQLGQTLGIRVGESPAHRCAARIQLQ